MGRGRSVRRGMTAASLAFAVLIVMAVIGSGDVIPAANAAASPYVVLGADQTNLSCTVNVDNNCAFGPTGIVNTSTNGFPAFQAKVGGNGNAIFGENDTGTGVEGEGDTGVYGYGQTGVEALGITGDGVSGRTLSGTKSGVHGSSDYGNGVEGSTTAEDHNGVYGHTNNADGSGVYGQNNGTGYGVAGRASSGTGVLGDGIVGMYSQGSITGIRAVSTGAGDGVDGQANNSCCSAVYGLNDGSGNGVAGRADTGTGVLAASTNGVALKVSGRAKFSRSGIVTVAAGSSSAVVVLPRVTTSSMVLATAQEASGVAVKAAVPANGKFTIYLTGNAPSGGLAVAYFILN
jgi:hypothetical protein